MLKQEIAELVKTHGMRNILLGLIEYLDFLEKPQDRYIRELREDLIWAYNRYEARYEK